MLPGRVFVSDETGKTKQEDGEKIIMKVP